MCPIGKFLLQHRMPREKIYHSPHLFKSTHYANKDNKSTKHSKDPRNCPVVLYFDSSHFMLISFLLREPIMVMPISNTQRSIYDLSRMLGVDKKVNDIYRSFRRVVHDYIFKMVTIIKKKQKNEIEENMEGESGTELKVTKPADPRRKKAPPLLKNFYKKQHAIQSDHEKDILGRNSKVNFTPGKMRKYLFSLIITEITP